MDTPIKIFVVTSGSYSDYGMEAMFTRREDAEVYMTTCANEPDIEEWELDQYKECKVVKVFKAEINLHDGILVEKSIPTILESKVSPEKSHVHVTEFGGRHEWHCAMATSIISQEHANKLAVEARQKWLREKELERDMLAFAHYSIANSM